MKPTKLLYVIAIAAAFAGDANAVYKCTTAKGVVYQDRPCVEGAQTDVQLVVPTGEVFAKPTASNDDAAQPGGIGGDGRAGPAKGARGPRPDSPTLAHRDARANDAAAAAQPTNRVAGRTGAEAAGTTAGDKRTGTDAAAVPMTPEQARNAEPTAKYYTTDGAAPGNETPQQMTCESPTGEKRVFILSKGKLTSI